MSYNALSKLSDDGYLHRRVVACAASLSTPDPERWAYDNKWELALRPGWATAYLQSKSPTPGADDDVITDEMILAAVQALRSTP